MCGAFFDDLLRLLLLDEEDDDDEEDEEEEEDRLRFFFFSCFFSLPVLSGDLLRSITETSKLTLKHTVTLTEAHRQQKLSCRSYRRLAVEFTEVSASPFFFRRRPVTHF